MTTLIAAGSMAKARDIAAAHGWPRSSWRYVYDGTDIDAAPFADVYVDATADAHPRAVSIHDAVHRILTRKTPVPGADRRRRGAGTLGEPKGATP